MEIICSECGSLLQEEDIFCPNCGLRREEKRTVQPETEFYSQNYEYDPNPTPVTMPANYHMPGPMRVGSHPISKQYIGSTENLSPEKKAAISRNKAAQLSFEFGLISLFILPVLGSFIAIPAGIFGIKSDYKNKAIQGIIMGVIGLVICPLVILYIFTF